MTTEAYEDSLSPMECHYTVNGAWLRSDTQLLDDLQSFATFRRSPYSADTI
jgi:hypothetical protein